MYEITSPSTVEAFSTFLKYGPTGLAALMLFLVIVALSIGSLTEARERLLKQFMYIGAFCFTLALAANFFSVAGAYPLHFYVFPLDLGKTRTLPPPIVKANNTTLDDNNTYLVKSEVTAMVDVTDAINFVQNIRSQNISQRQALQGIATGADALVSELQKIPQVIDNNCPGGSNGRPASSNKTVLEITNRAAAGIAGFKASASAAVSP